METPSKILSKLKAILQTNQTDTTEKGDVNKDLEHEHRSVIQSKRNNEKIEKILHETAK